MSTDTRDALAARLEHTPSLPSAWPFPDAPVVVPARLWREHLDDVVEAARLLREDGERTPARALTRALNLLATLHDRLLTGDAALRERGAEEIEAYLHEIAGRSAEELLREDGERETKIRTEVRAEFEQEGRYHQGDLDMAEARGYVRGKSEVVRTPPAPNRAALSALYLEAHRAGVEAAVDYLYGVGDAIPADLLKSDRDELMAQARAFVADERNWRDPGSPLAACSAARPVHDHGPEEGPGLACREHRDESGRLVGECMRSNAADVLAKIDAAEAMVTALCKPRGTPGTREWTMSVPARPDHDPDLVIGDALHAARRLILAHPDAEEPAVVRAAWLREFSRLQSALVEATWRCADKDEDDTPFKERQAEMDRAVKALYAHVEALAHPDAGSEVRELVEWVPTREDRPFARVARPWPDAEQHHPGCFWEPEGGGWPGWNCVDACPTRCSLCKHPNHSSAWCDVKGCVCSPRAERGAQEETRVRMREVLAAFLWKWRWDVGPWERAVCDPIWYMQVRDTYRFADRILAALRGEEVG